MFDGFISRRLSRKLLLLTICFVMLAELLLFVPSAALFRQSWFADRVQEAGLLAQAITGVPDFKASELLTQQFMDDTDVIVMSTKRDGMSELVLGGFQDTDIAIPADAEFRMVDIREKRSLPMFRDTFIDFFGPKEGYLRVIANSPVEGQESFELIIPREKIRHAMRDYFVRVFWLSLIIAIITGSMIYLSMSALIIRPIQRLADDMTRFRKNPNLSSAAPKKANRKDEIGQLEREFIDMKKSLRASFRQRERLASLGLSMAKINHDLRNVLTGALMMSDRLAGDKEALRLRI